MILNVSRGKSFRLCKRKGFNTYHRGREGARSMNLVDGGAFHKGVAVGRSTQDWEKAKLAARAQFEEDVQKSSIPPEQDYLISEHQALVERMLQVFAEQYEHEKYQVLQTECEFDVELPASHHHCIFIHWCHTDEGEMWGPPDPESILAGKVRSPHKYSNPGCICYVPHRFVGRTDAVISWNQNVWVDEYKTSSIQGDMFWDQWQLEFQPTAYLYGIWKKLGLRPRGFLLNAMFKPSEAQLAGYNRNRAFPKPVTDYIKLEREGFFRSEADLMRVERQLLQICYEWEREICDPQMPDRFSMTPTNTTCKSFNRKCDFYGSCMAHDQDINSMPERVPDYVDDKLVQLMSQKEGERDDRSCY